MPEVMTEKSLVIRPNAEPVLMAGVIPPGIVVLHVEADGVAHYVRFGPHPADFDAGEQVALSLLRCIAKARLVTEAVAAGAVIAVPPPGSTLPPPMGK